MPQAGPNNGSTFANDSGIGTIPWPNPSNAQTSNDIYASVVLNVVESSNYLKATGFGFALPANAVVLGIVVEVERYASQGGKDTSVKLVKNGVISGNDKADTVTAWPVADAYKSYGGVSDLWGLAWTVSDINAADFGVAVAGQNASGLDGDALYIDHIRITVHYELREDLSATVVSISTVSDVQQFIESLSAAVASVSSVADLQTFVESLLATIASSSAVTEYQAIENKPLNYYATRLLVDILAASTHRISTDYVEVTEEDLSVSRYSRRLLNAPEILRELTDIFYGRMRPHDVTLECGDADRYLWSLMQGEELRAKGVKIRRYESGESVAANRLKFEVYGVIKQVKRSRGKVLIALSIFDPDPLQTLLPRKTVESGDHPSTPQAGWGENPGDEIYLPSVDFGKAYPLPFGRCSKVPLRFIRANYTKDWYDFAIGHVGTTPIESNNANKAATVVVYQSKAIVTNQARYTVFDGSQASPYPGYAFVRFDYEPRDSSGNRAPVHMDLRGIKLSGATAERNFVRVVEHILKNAQWGLGLTINQASVDSAAAAVADLLCDGYISDQRRAEDVLNDLLFACRGRRDKNEQGEIILKVDAYQPTVQAEFGPAKGRIVEVSGVWRTPTSEAVKTWHLNYRFDEWQRTYKQKTSLRTVFAFGRSEVAVESPFVRDHATADKIACYQQKLRQLADEQVELKVGLDARHLVECDPIRIVSPAEGVEGIYQVRSIRKEVSGIEIRAVGYAPAIFTYEAGTLPGDENPDDETDWAFTPPSAMAALAIDSQGTYQSSDGTTLAYVLLKANAPGVNFQKAQFGYRKLGESVYTWLDGEETAAPQWKCRIDGLVPAVHYDFAAVAVNQFNLRSPVATLADQTAPGDTTSPGQPGIHYGYVKGKTWNFAVNPVAEARVKSYRWQIATDPAFNSVIFDKKGLGPSVEHTNDAYAYNTTLYAHAKAVSFSDVESASWSGTASATNARAQTDDLTDNVVTTAKRQDVNEQSFYVLSILPGAFYVHLFTHNLNRKPVVTAYAALGASNAHINIQVVNATQIQVRVFNAGATEILGITLTVNYW